MLNCTIITEDEQKKLKTKAIHAIDFVGFCLLKCRGYELRLSALLVLYSTLTDLAQYA